MEQQEQEEEDEERGRKEGKKEGAVEKMKRLLRVDSDETDDLHDKYRYKSWVQVQDIKVQVQKPSKPILLSFVSESFQSRFAASSDHAKSASNHL